MNGCLVQLGWVLLHISSPLQLEKYAIFSYHYYWCLKLLISDFSILKEIAICSESSGLPCELKSNFSRFKSMYNNALDKEYWTKKIDIVLLAFRSNRSYYVFQFISPENSVVFLGWYVLHLMLLIEVWLSFAVGHCNKNNVIFAAGAKSYMRIVSQWCCLHCDSSSAFNVWWHCHIWGLSTLFYLYKYWQFWAWSDTWWRTMLVLCGIAIYLLNISHVGPKEEC